MIMLQKIVTFLLCIFLILLFSLTTVAHPLILNISYDECSQEELVDGKNEIWYKIDEISTKFPNTSLHLSDTVDEIKYYFSPTAENSNDDWITCVKRVANSSPWYTVLSDSEASAIANRIKSVYAESMEKWNDVYYYSYDSGGNRVANKIITVTEGTATDHNVKIYPTSQQGESIASTVIRSDVDYWDVLAHNHAHIPTYEMIVNINDFYEATEGITPDTETIGIIIRENTGAHEIGHMLGLADLDGWCTIECTCDICTDNDSSNDEDCTYKGHHEEALMGYGQTESRVTHITYKDIAGVSITRGFHTDSDHVWMLRINTENNTKDVICALCNGVKLSIQNDVQFNGGVYYYLGEEIPVFGSCNNAHDINNSNMLLVATDSVRDFYKCLCCRYIKEVQHSTHSYTQWTKYSSTHHIECCKYCGLTGTAMALHYVKQSEIINNVGFCVECGARVMLGDDFVQVGPASITKVTINGSYILPNGIIVLVDEDIEAYENGTLVWYDKDKLPQTQ